MRANRIVLATFAAAGALIAPATAAAIPAGSTALIDRPTGFGPLPFDGSSESDSGQHAITPDGRYVVFASGSDALLEGDDDASFNIYRLDRRRGVVEQVNTTVDGRPQGLNSSFSASISADGRYVAFSTFGDALFPGAPQAGVFVKDMVTGKVELASRGDGPDGAPAPPPDFPSGAISGDGRHVAFISAGPVHADNADGRTNQVDAYVRDLDAAKTQLVSVKGDGTAGGGIDGRDPPVLSFDGTAVAFIAQSSLAAGDTDQADDAYVRTGIGTAGAKTSLVSFSAGQTPGADIADQVDIGGDGKEVAWSDGGGVYYAELTATVGKATRVDVSKPGGDQRDDGERPSFEPVDATNQKPKRIYFRTDSALIPLFDVNTAADVYDADTAFIGNADHLGIDTDGTRESFIDDVSGAGQGAIVIYDAQSDELPGGSNDFNQVYQSVGGRVRNISQPPGRAPRTDEVSQAGIVENHALSDDGQRVVFATNSPALGSDDGSDQIVLRDVVTGKTTLISRTPDGSPTGNGAFGPSIDAAGDKVAFVSGSNDLLASGNPANVSHVYVRDLASGDVTLVDRRADGQIANGNVTAALISPDGHHVVYSSNATDLPGAPPAPSSHVYVVDLDSGGTKLVDATPAGTRSNADTLTGFDVSGDGSIVAFNSGATNLGVTGASPVHTQIYVRNFAANTLDWASSPDDGDGAHSNATAPSLSRDGSRVAFNQSNLDFGHGMSRGTQVFVRDLPAQTTTLASDVSGVSFTFAEAPTISGDGRRVAFPLFVGDGLQAALAATPAAADGGAASSGIYVRDLRADAPRFLVGSGSNDPFNTIDIHTAASLDGTGSCIAFASAGISGLTDPSYGPDFTHVYMQALEDDCPGSAVQPPPAGPPPGGGVPSGPGDKPHDNGPAPDKTAPKIGSAKLTHRTFAVGRSATVRSARVAVGTTFKFSLSEPAATTIVISQRVRRAHTPTRVVKVVTLKRAKTVKGANRVAFTGKVGRATLKPGTYQAVLTARDRAGNVSKPVTLTFKVVRE